MNVIFILADDLGWSDTTLYGHTSLYETPNIERLAKRGQTFTRAYAASPLCSPTRASILTGQTPAQLGLTNPICHEPQVVLEAEPKPFAPPGSKATEITPPNIAHAPRVPSEPSRFGMAWSVARPPEAPRVRPNTNLPTM